MAVPKSLRQLIADVEEELQHAPRVQAHKEDIKNKLNEALRELGASLEWPWLLREAPVWVIPDIPVTPTLVTSSQRHFELDPAELEGKLWSATEFASADDSRLSLQMQSLLAGMEFHATGPASALTGTNWWVFAPFVIDEAILDPTTPEIILDPRAAFGTALTGNEGIVLRQNRIRLPADVDEVVSLEDERGAAVMPANENQLRMWGRGPDLSPGKPTHYSYDYGFQRRHGELFAPGLLVPGGNAAAYQTPGAFDYVMGMALRDESWTATATSGGSLPAGTYSLRICWWAAGQFGPIGDREVQVTTAGGNATISLAGLPVLASTGVYGRKLMVWAREVRSGLDTQGDYYLLAARLDSTSATLAIASRPDTTLPHQQARLSRMHPFGQYTYLRLWPRSSTLARYRLYYYKRPDELEEPSDVPEFAAPYHDLLMWRTVEKLGARWDSVTASRARGEADRLQRALEGHYRTGQRAPRRKGQIDDGRGRHWVEGFDGVNWQG